MESCGQAYDSPDEHGNNHLAVNHYDNFLDPTKKLPLKPQNVGGCKLNESLQRIHDKNIADENFIGIS
ncbi:hypothetical protein HZS_435 [Henneguya salminicola]|nr:hypothetical protein HZS_435 [Henneguya salminicola]